MKLFNYDSPFWSFMSRLADLIILNLLWIVFCIPVVTIGASTTAMYRVTLNMVRGEGSGVVRMFWDAFRLNLKQAVLIFLILLIPVLLVVFPAVLPHSPSMHKGYDLYNAAIPIGLIAFFLRSLLYKVFLPAPPASEGVGLGDSFPVLSFVFCGVVFGLAIIWGLAMGGGKEYGKLLRDSGYNVDYGTKYGSGASVLNFGIYGLFIVLYYVLIGAKWNAATLGCVFCMVCCCYKGSHPANVWPIMVGYVAASYVAQSVCSLTGAEHTLMANAQAIVIGLCFANGLSPVTGVYGWLAGVLFGMIHYTFVTCVPLLHGAFCLYNGGFTAGFTCFLFIPVLEHFCKTKQQRKELKAGK